jgi:pimeloyl-ACP methyl ester carboxylesterase
MLKQINFLWQTIKSLFLDDYFLRQETFSVKHFNYNGIISNFYEHHGSNKNVILIIPGFSQPLSSWMDIAEKLPKNFSLFILELPNKGKSKGKIKQWNEKDFAGFVLEFIHKQIPHKQIIVVGHSLGAKVAALTSLCLKTRIILLILYAAGGINVPPSPAKMLINLLKRLLYRKHSRIDFDKIYQQISIPTLLIYGEKDIITPIEVGKAIFRKIPKAKFVIIPGATHLAHKDTPDVFVKHVLDATKSLS